MFHAHVYFDLPEQTTAEAVHQRIRQERSDITAIFPLVHRKVGPHDKPMFEVHFLNNDLGFIEWLDQHRKGLTVLIHPVSDEELADHTSRAQWLGNPLPIHTHIFDQ
ncbi:DOPA 4,5-dioxygenase family protein [Photobacterium sp. TY1-4]|uniref:DOPA 4,5-dioxygenase family protein n=1 Tax=Photobacterium sp. TY1-4 TaxID=2899122 RepID=UPI0021BF42A8|nr:DOPA 4,5-dioxygenase family protein [Photobacterium sp. TY1-4]UXI03849.1 DOPA 4,5-dioxygenase family protein [Photobacterium sp. TY1-4]